MWGPLGVSITSQEGEDFTLGACEGLYNIAGVGPSCGAPGGLHSITGGRGLHMGACEGLYSITGLGPSHRAPWGSP